MTASIISYHLWPRSGWINDPNGMARVNGVWHVFFQHNPDAPVHDRIAWGHATSRDLSCDVAYIQRRSSTEVRNGSPASFHPVTEWLQCRHGRVSMGVPSGLGAVRGGTAEPSACPF